MRRTLLRIVSGAFIGAALAAGAAEQPAAPAEEADLGKRIDALIRKLGADEFAERVRAEEALRAIGFPAYRKLRDAVNGDDPEIRSRARGVIGNYDAINELLDKLPQDWHTTLYYDSLTETQQKLAAHGGTAVPYIADRLQREKDNLYRFNCVTILDKIATPAALACLRKLAGDIDAWCRVESVWALGNAKDADSLLLLVAALDDKDENVRKEALVAISKVAGITIYGLTPTITFQFASALRLTDEARQELERVTKYFMEHKALPDAEELQSGHVIRIVVGGGEVPPVGRDNEKLKGDWKVKTFSARDGAERWIMVRFEEEPEFVKARAEPAPAPPPEEDEAP